MMVKTKDSSRTTKVVPLSDAEKRFRQKEQLLTAVGKLNDKDTVEKAKNEITGIIKDIDMPRMSTLVHCVCQTGSEQKAFTRKECLEVISLLGSDACALQAQVFAPPLLSKIASYVKARLKDTDGAVRDTVAKVCGELAKNMTIASGNILPGDDSNLLLKAAFESMSDQKKEVQIAAVHTVEQIGSYVGPLDVSMFKTLLKYTASKTFQGRAGLLAAIGNYNDKTHKLNGFLRYGGATFARFRSAFFGSSKSGGLLGCIACKDWPVRKAAVDAANALLLTMGPLLDEDTKGGDNRLAQLQEVLEECRHDKFRPVRDSAQHALATCKKLDTFLSAGHAQETWSEFCGVETTFLAGYRDSCACSEVDAAECAALNFGSPVQPSRTRPQAEAGAALPAVSTAADQQYQPVDEPAANPSGAAQTDMVAQVQNAAEITLCETFLSDPQQENVMPLKDATPAKFMQRASPVRHSTGRLFSRSPAAAAVSSPPLSEMFSRDQMSAATPPLSSKAANSPSRQQNSVDAPHIKVMMKAIQDLKLETRFLRQEVHRLGKAQNAANARIRELESDVLVLKQLNGVAVEETENAENTAPGTAGPQLISDDGNAVHASWHASSPAASQTSEFSFARPLLCDTPVIAQTSPSSPTMANNWLRRSAPNLYGSFDEDGFVTPNAKDMEAAFAEVLATPNPDLRLLRLMQRSGPAYQELTPVTCCQLVAALQHMVQSNTSLSRVVPWLGQLADEPEASHSLPEDLKNGVITALENCVANSEVIEQATTAAQALKAAWQQRADAAVAADVSSTSQHGEQRSSELDVALATICSIVPETTGAAANDSAPHLEEAPEMHVVTGAVH